MNKNSHKPMKKEYNFDEFSFMNIQVNRFLVQSLPMNKTVLIGRIRPIFIYFFKVFHRPRGPKLNKIGCF